MNTKNSTNEKEWQEVQALSEHSMESTAIDWNHAKNRIVSGSIDRSVFVFCFDEEQKMFKPEFVNMDEKLSIIDIKWARNGKKFVSGTSSKKLYVVHEYNKVAGVNWTSKAIKAKFDSSILSA